VTPEESGFLGDFVMTTEDTQYKSGMIALEALEEAWAGISDTASDAGDVMAGVLDDVAAGAEGTVEKVEEVEEAQWSASDAALAAGHGAAGIASMFIDSEAAKAGIRATMEVAESIAAFATPGGVPAGIAHAAAAVQFGIAAGMGSGGGGKGASSAPGAGAARSANRDRLNASEKQPTETNINLDFSRSVGVGPQAARELSEEVARGVAMTSKGSGRLF
jgi:hypothetical protein